MAPRASWKGFLKIAELTCPVALYTTVSTSERIAFHTLNRATGHRVRRQFIDRATGAPVEAGEQIKGYEVGSGEYVMLDPEEIASAVPQSDKTLAVQAFVPIADIDDVYFDRPYYLAPSDPGAAQAFAMVCEAMRAKKVAALARAVLFRKLRTVLLRPYRSGLIATTLNFDYEVRSAADAFHDIPDLTIKGEMLDLATHIIATKRGTFDPTKFDDRYEAALAEVVRAKLEGKPIAARKPPASAKVVDLMQALKQSAAASGRPKQGGRKDRQEAAGPGKTVQAKGKTAASKKASNKRSRSAGTAVRRKAS